MAVYLIDHPPVRSQYRSPRRAKPSGVIVVHTAENAPDYVAFDGGAEAVARFIQSRTDPGSYHELVDSDSAIQLVRYSDEAFHDATGSNPHSLSVSIATRADVWPLAPKAWRDGAVEQAAQAAARQARWVKATTGIVIPARRITRDESERRVPGFISHAQRDPARRTDPGKDFPWSAFLARYSELTGSTAAPTQEDDDMPLSEAEGDALHEILVWTRNASGALRKIIAQGAADAAGDDVDEEAVARLVLAGLDPAVIAAAIPADIAKQVADELASRLNTK
jgi:hypothetical protein